MIDDVPNPDNRRKAIGFTFLVLGMLLVLWGWVSWGFREAVQNQPRTTIPEKLETNQQVEWLGANALVLVVGFLLFLMVLVGSLAIVRLIRRRQAAIARTRPAPTEFDDVWSQHRLPDEEP